LLAEHDHILLSDFGFAESIHLSDFPDSGQATSSVLYMAPEQLLDQAQEASDQYALGAMVYEWLCGTPPFTGSAGEVARQQIETPPASLARKNPQLSPLVEEVVMIALAKDPGKRFASITSFATAFEQAASS
jgi:serine/threonine protein kinase